MERRLSHFRLKPWCSNLDRPFSNTGCSVKLEGGQDGILSVVIRAELQEPDLRSQLPNIAGASQLVCDLHQMNLGNADTSAVS